MRDLLFKNITSDDKKRRIVSSYEVSDKQGIRSVVRRHFVCIVREVAKECAYKPPPFLHVLRERNTKEKKEEFFCRLKGSILVENKKKVFLVLFTHSLKITLTAITNEAVGS